VSAAGLEKAFAAPGATIASLARRFGVSDATVARWLADAGLLPPDPSIDHRRLEKLYVNRALTIAEVAEKLRISPARVSRARSWSPASISGPLPRAAVTDRRLVDLSVTKKHSVVETAGLLGVSTEYVSKRLHEAGLTKRPGDLHPPMDRGIPTISGTRLPTSTKAA
jgi:transposase-like protein